MQHDDPPKGMKRQASILVVGPAGYRIESYSDWIIDGPGEQVLWLFGARGQVALKAPDVLADNLVTLDRFAIAPDAMFICGTRKAPVGTPERQ